MIAKIPDLNVWICKYRETYEVFRKTDSHNIYIYVKLPLFDIRLKRKAMYTSAESEDYVALISCEYINQIYYPHEDTKYTLKSIKTLNKINEFWDIILTKEESHD